jgi:hypothetical protein
MNNFQEPQAGTQHLFGDKPLPEAIVSQNSSDHASESSDFLGE